MPYKERGGWRAIVKVNGKRTQKWFPSKKDAQAWESATRKDLKHKKPKTSTALLGLCGDYLTYMARYSKSTYSHKKTLCKRILAEWGDIDSHDITPKMCLDYLDKRALISGNAANEDLYDLKTFFGHLRKIYNIDHNPLRDIEPYVHEVKPPYVPPREDILKLLLVTTEQDRVMLDMFRFTAARRSEVMRLTWDDIQFDKRVISLKTHKNRKGQCKTYYVPMSDSLYQSLQWQWNHRDKSSSYVFTHNGKSYARREAWLPSLCEKAKIKPFGYHSFRRAFATGIMATGKASMKDTSMLMGHSSTRHTETYLRSINPNLPGLVEMLDEKSKYPMSVPLIWITN
jgi:integrase